MTALDTLSAYVEGRSTRGARPVPLRRKYLWAIETAKELIAVNNDPKRDLRREIMFALRRCGPISVVDLIELLIVALDSDDDLETIRQALADLEDPKTPDQI